MAIGYIQSGKLNQNAYIEWFNHTYRDKLLDPHLFAALEDVREATYWWMIEYNEQRPHDSLGDLTPHGSPRASRQKLYFRTVLLTGKLTPTLRAMPNAIFLILIWNRVATLPSPRNPQVLPGGGRGGFRNAATAPELCGRWVGVPATRWPCES